MSWWWIPIILVGLLALVASILVLAAVLVRRDDRP